MNSNRTDVSDKKKVVLESDQGAADFPVVGVGASAGGLESLEELFSKVPVNSGMAFIVIQHLSPDFKSVMDELLARRTNIPIQQAEDGLIITPDRIFLIPPKKDAIIADGRFRLRDKDPKETLTLPIDHFFRSLAQDAGNRAIAVILSGSGSDGSRGIRDVHEAGGLIICESEETAKFDGMPQSARDTGLVDLILQPADISDAIEQHISFQNGKEFPESEKAKPADEGYELIFDLLNHEYGINFSHYKASTVNRRIQRRLIMQRIDSVNEYAEQLRNDFQEQNSLYLDLLIGVTHFFRDPKAFKKLEEKIIPELVDRTPPDEEIRIWVAACATGEEAYSIAILFHEELKKRNRSLNLKIFATDVHKASLEFASAGKYQEDSLKEVSAALIKEYFHKTRNGYTVDPELRKSIVFAQHNVLKDAPFTKLDLISCRNLLIYFQPKAQKRSLSLFHFGLKSGGILMLGPSESPGELSDEFDSIDGHWKLYQKRRDIRLPADIRGPLPHTDLSAKKISTIIENKSTKSEALDASLIGAYDWILSSHIPAAVLIDDQHQLLHVFGEADSFMKLRKGRPSSNALDYFEDDLRTALSSAMQRIKKDPKRVYYSGIHLKADKHEEVYRVCVEPVENKYAKHQQYLIKFENIGKEDQNSKKSDLTNEDIKSQHIAKERINNLETELQHNKETLKSTVEELETANEELQAANEELIASNEELQSTNEELHSVNEELYTVNAEYQNKINDLTVLTSDMDSLMESTDVATVFLDENLCIRKFTPQIGPIFKLVPQDLGRCIDSFAHHLDRPGLINDIRSVLESSEPLEEEVQDNEGRWLYLRVLPYRSKRTTKGVVLTLTDINTLKKTQDSLSIAVKNREQFLAMLSHELRNPISAVSSASHLLTTDKNQDSTSQKAVSVIQQQAAHMSRLLDDLLNVSRMTQDKLELRKKNINLIDTIQESINSMQPILKQENQELKVDFKTDQLLIHGDHDRLRQVVVNLIDNAVKYSDQGGTIKISTVKENDWAILKIEDKGRGIPEEMINSIFEPFVQSYRTHENHNGGMGLGLSLVKFIVNGHGGKIEVKSKGSGEGSIFTIWLPLLKHNYKPSGTSSTQIDKDTHQHDKSTNSNKTLHKRPEKLIQSITVIEDQKSNREMLSALLNNEGYDVNMADNGETGFQTIMETLPDAAVIDIGLPLMDGYEVARQVRLNLGEDIFLIALTGYGQPEDISAAKDAGFNEYLVKPLDLNQLQKLLKQDNT